jgi:hypothetical protein
MEKHILSKSTFIRGTQCLKSLYLNKKRPFLRDKLSPEQLAKFRRGHRVGSLAQKLFPGGTDFSPRSPALYQKAVLETREAIRINAFDILYEAGFQYDQLLILLDILVKETNEWVAYEVKSSYKISDTFILDAAFQYYVITNSGLSIKDFIIVYASEELDYKKIDEYEHFDDLFIKESVMEKIIPLQDFIKEQVYVEKETLLMNHSPKIDMGPQCYSPYPCDFIGHCTKSALKK